MKQNSKMTLRNPPEESNKRKNERWKYKAWGWGVALRKHTVINPLSPTEMSVFEAASDNVTSFSRP